MNKTSIAYLTGTRADFGLFLPLLRAFASSDEYDLHLFATGMHLMPEYGLSLTAVTKEFPDVTALQATYQPDSQASNAVFLAKLLPLVVESFLTIKPDLIFVHGDRIEMLAAALAGYYLQIPICHTQGGDITSTIDNQTRDLISMLATLHFPATEAAKQKLEALGVNQDSIFVVGTLSLDTLLNTQLYSQEKVLSFLERTNNDYVVITLHPISEAISEAAKQMEQTLSAVKSSQLPAIIVYPNADPGSNEMIAVIQQYTNEPNWKIYKNLDYLMFNSIVHYAKLWVSNSSAGIVDSPSLGVPVVNVGPRQKGRQQAANIINSDYDSTFIQHAIKKALTDQDFLRSAFSHSNPWGKGNAVPQILEVVRTTVVLKQTRNNLGGGNPRILTTGKKFI